LDESAPSIPPLRRNNATLPHAGAELLDTLRVAKVAGFTASTWAAVATAVSPTGTNYQATDINWLLEHAADMIVVLTSGKEPTYTHRESPKNELNRSLIARSLTSMRTSATSGRAAIADNSS
jgi:hypothetical protein